MTRGGVTLAQWLSRKLVAAPVPTTAIMPTTQLERRGGILVTTAATGSGNRSGSHVAPSAAVATRSLAEDDRGRQGQRRRAELVRQTTKAFSDAVYAVDKRQLSGRTGIPRQLYTQVRGVFLEMLRRHHVVVSVFSARGDAALLMTQPQRMVVLACLLFTSMCVTALLFGHRSEQLGTRLVAGVVSALCMVPCRVLLPALYRSANAPLVAGSTASTVTSRTDSRQPSANRGRSSSGGGGGSGSGNGVDLDVKRKGSSHDQSGNNSRSDRVRRVLAVAPLQLEGDDRGALAVTATATGTRSRSRDSEASSKLDQRSRSNGSKAGRRRASVEPGPLPAPSASGSNDRSDSNSAASGYPSGSTHGQATTHSTQAGTSRSGTGLGVAATTRMSGTGPALPVTIDAAAVIKDIANASFYGSWRRRSPSTASGNAEDFTQVRLGVGTGRDSIGGTTRTSIQGDTTNSRTGTPPNPEAPFSQARVSLKSHHVVAASHSESESSQGRSKFNLKLRLVQGTGSGTGTGPGNSTASGIAGPTRTQSQHDVDLDANSSGLAVTSLNQPVYMTDEERVVLISCLDWEADVDLEPVVGASGVPANAAAAGALAVVQIGGTGSPSRAGSTNTNGAGGNGWGLRRGGGSVAALVRATGTTVGLRQGNVKLKPPASGRVVSSPLGVFAAFLSLHVAVRDTLT